MVLREILKHLYQDQWDLETSAPSLRKLESSVFLPSQASLAHPRASCTKSMWNIYTTSETSETTYENKKHDEYYSNVDCEI